MPSLKNAHVAKEVNVTVQTVQRWMNDAKENLNKLTLIEESGRLKFEDTVENWEEFKRLAENARKFKPTSNLLKAKPDPKFFETFNNEEAIEIISDLESKKRINMKWTYFGEGATIWNRICSSHEYKSNKVFENMTEEVLNIYGHRMPSLYNLIDIGPGNGKTIQNFINKEKNKINKYVGVDISRDILKITAKNIESAFSDLNCEYYILDLEKSVPKKIGFNSENIYVFIGGTTGSFDNLAKFYEDMFTWMEPKSYLLIEDLIKDEKNLSFSNFYNRKTDLTRIHFFILEMLGFDTDKCQIKYDVDYQQSMKNLYLVLDRDYNIDFSDKFPGRIIKFDKGDKIRIANYKMYSFVETVQIVINAGFLVDLYLVNKEKTAYGMILRKP